jgi:hypothetical protein
MIRQARSGDIVLDKSREMTGRTQTLPWWPGWGGGEGVKTTEIKIHWFRWFLGWELLGLSTLVDGALI